VKGGRGLVWAGDVDELRGAVSSFLASIRNEASSFDRVFATVLFTDIVNSTAQSAALGDTGWRTLQDAHDAVVRELLTEPPRAERVAGRSDEGAARAGRHNLDRPNAG
jgi:class 3 adenylate cyclase